MKQMNEAIMAESTLTWMVSTLIAGKSAIAPTHGPGGRTDTTDITGGPAGSWSYTCKMDTLSAMRHNDKQV